MATGSNADGGIDDLTNIGWLIQTTKDRLLKEDLSERLNMGFLSNAEGESRYRRDSVVLT